MGDFSEWRELTYYGNRLDSWVEALAVAAGLFAVALFVKLVIGRRLAQLANRTATQADDMVVELVRRTQLVLLAFPALFLGLLGVELPGRPHRVLLVLTTIAVFIQVGLWLGAVLDFLVNRYRRRNQADPEAPAPTTVAALAFGGRVVIWSLLALIALENLGFDVTTLVAGLGVGGIAIALATQNILGDLFSSLSIVVDKPFEVGDAIQIGEFSGTVEMIGLKTTRLRSVNGEQIVFANSDLLQSRIRNLARLTERRVVVPLGVVYQTPVATLEQIPPMLRELVAATPGLRFDRCHFRGFGASSLDFELVYWVEQPDLASALDAQEAVNFGILRRFAAASIDLAYPTQTLYLSRVSKPETGSITAGGAAAELPTNSPGPVATDSAQST